jgi:hypothetical protein
MYWGLLLHQLMKGHTMDSEYTGISQGGRRNGLIFPEVNIMGTTPLGKSGSIQALYTTFSNSKNYERLHFNILQHVDSLLGNDH